MPSNRVAVDAVVIASATMSSVLIWHFLPVLKLEMADDSVSIQDVADIMDTVDGGRFVDACTRM
jgi:hypothetical protein